MVIESFNTIHSEHHHDDDDDGERRKDTYRGEIFVYGWDFETGEGDGELMIGLYRAAMAKREATVRVKFERERGLWECVIPNLIERVTRDGQASGGNLR